MAFVNSLSNNMKSENWGRVVIVVCHCGMISGDWSLGCQANVRLSARKGTLLSIRPIPTLMDTNIMISYDDVKFTVDVSKARHRENTKQTNYLDGKWYWLLMSQTRSVNFKVFAAFLGSRGIKNWLIFTTHTLRRTVLGPPM